MPLATRHPSQPTSTGCSTRACAAWAVDIITPSAGSPIGPASAAAATILLRISWPAIAGDAAAAAQAAGNYTVSGSFLYRNPAVARVESLYPAGRSCSAADAAAVTVAIRISGARCSSNLSARFLLPAPASVTTPVAVVPVCADLPAVASSGSSGALLTLAAPPHGRAGTATVEILAGPGRSAIASANFTYNPATLVLMPADAPAGSGGNLTATVWGWGGGGDGWGATAVVARVADGADGIERVATVDFVETVRILLINILLPPMT